MPTKKPANPQNAQIEARAEEIVNLTAEFCSRYLDDEYAQLCKKFVLKMGRKRAVPFVAGRTTIWAGAVIYALGQINFLFDRSQKPYVARADIAQHFGTTTTTLGQKAKALRDMFKLRYWDPEFSTSESRASNPLAGMVMVNGLVVPVAMIPKLLDRSGK
jgi:hypothetical protein